MYDLGIHKNAILSRDKERELLKLYKTTGDAKAREKLIMGQILMVMEVAYGLKGYHIPFNDLVQEGTIGVMLALEKFSLEYDVRLVTFTIHTVKEKMYEYILKNVKMLNIATTKPKRKLFFGMRKYKKDWCSYTEEQIQTIAKDLNVKPSEVREMEIRLSPISMRSFGNAMDAIDMSDHNNNFGYDAIFAKAICEISQTPEENTADIFLCKSVYTSLGSLDPRSKDIMTKRWLIDNDESHTLCDLAEEHGVSAERIRQIEKAAMKKMRTGMVN